ncbi:hypothetical protein F7D01_00100 [Erythrobacter sp. 3-20A1M]|nr:hypothetical protein F7D01_00100 [Erythrobacter sp. 3-20A1M]
MATEAKGSAKKASASAHRTEAKSRFNAALDEAKAGAAALRAEAGDRASAYRTKAKGKQGEYSDQAKVKANELAVEGKTRASDAIAALSKYVADNAAKLDENFGPKYGDYARNASRSLHETATRLDDKSVNELGEDARQWVRNSPGLAVGLAAVGGYMVARMFRR